MTTGNCKYEDGIVESCFDCGCDECSAAIAEYAMYLDEQSKEDEFSRLILEAEYQTRMDEVKNSHG